MTITGHTKLAGWTTKSGVVYGIAADGPGELERLSRGWEEASTVDRVLSWKSLANQAARAHKLPLAWILGVMHAESGGKPDVVSPAGAVGLMQIMPTTAALYSVPKEHLFHPGTNIFLGARILRDLQTAKSSTPQYDLPAVASMYNAGPAEGEIRPKASSSSPFGYAEDTPYIFDVCVLNNFYQPKGGTWGPAFVVLGLLASYRLATRGFS